MENPIEKYIEILKKEAINKPYTENSIDGVLSLKEKLLIKDKISLDFTIENWFQKNINNNFSGITTFIPSRTNKHIFDLLSLDIGYKRSVKK
ncbi:MAG: hypothetical protein PF518_12995, partial [Spirochaetaceae bacterium]|nr:hypothetical protein [Spirochaetaceae bacterium]